MQSDLINAESSSGNSSIVGFQRGDWENPWPVNCWWSGREDGSIKKASRELKGDET